MRVNTLSRDVFHWKFHRARLNLNDFSIQIFKLRAHTIVVKHSKIEFYQQRRFAYNKIIFIVDFELTMKSAARISTTVQESSVQIAFRCLFAFSRYFFFPQPFLLASSVVFVVG